MKDKALKGVLEKISKEGYYTEIDHSAKLMANIDATLVIATVINYFQDLQNPSSIKNDDIYCV